jgi:hypothetical protein
MRNTIDRIADHPLTLPLAFVASLALLGAIRLAPLFL